MLENTEPSGQPAPKPDLNEVFDLDRKRLTRGMVDRMEQCMLEADAARDDLKQVLAECREAQFGPRDIEAMKKIAKLRKDDKGGAAKEQLAALERIAGIVGFDLFDWAESR
jgi:uncharacterized protein (UPF0335 family)